MLDPYQAVVLYRSLRRRNEHPVDTEDAFYNRYAGSRRFAGILRLLRLRRRA